MDAEDKQQTIESLYTMVVEILQADSPGMKLRESMANLVANFAELQVLCLTQEEKRSQFYADCPYISGELHRHIEKAVPHIELLREFKWKKPDASATDLVGMCNLRSGRWLFHLNGLNHVRYDFKDFDGQKDWLQPFVRAMLIWQEDSLREKLGLPPLLPDKLDGLKYSTFVNLVADGTKNPNYEWDKAWAPA
jgi:hypothetical protein